MSAPGGQRLAPWPVSRVYAAGVMLAGVFAWISWLQAPYWPDLAAWSAVASLAALGVLAEFTTVSLPSGGVISTAFALIMTTLLLFGPFPAIAVAGLSILFNTCLRRRRGLFVGLFNAGQYALAYSAAAAVLHLTYGTTVSGIAVSPNLILATTMATLTYMLVSSHLVNTYIHLEHGVPWDKNWWGDDRWEILLIIVLSPLAVLMASLYRTMGQPGLFLPFLPVLVIGYFVKSLLDSRQASEQLAAFTQELSVLHTIACKINAQPELQQMSSLIVSELRGVISNDFCDIYLLDQHTGRLRPQLGAAGGTALDAESGPLSLLLRADRPLRLDPSVGEDHLPAEWREYHSLLAAPIVSPQGPIGLLCLLHRERNAFTTNQEQLISLLAHQAATAIANAQLYAELQKLAITDGVTGIHNHRYFIQQLDAELRRAPRYGHPLSMIMLDVDYFKRFNDTHGHLLGDQVLRDIGMLLKATLRETDVVARYGGEEFAVILPYCDAEHAAEVAERVRRRVAEFPFQGREGAVQVTASLGIASCPKGYIERKRFVDLADMALYRAKHGGRNRLVQSIVTDAATCQYELLELGRTEEPPLRVAMMAFDGFAEEAQDARGTQEL